MWSWETAIEIFPILLEGFAVTIQVTLVGFIIALVLGLLFALGRRSRQPWLSRPTAGVIEFIRSTPLLVQLYFLYYVLPDFGMSMPALTTGILGLGVHYSTYLSEIYRSGIDGVPRGQWEAATALNIGRRRLWTSIILPQALPPLIPAIGNRLIAMFKQSALLAAITVPEVLLVAREVGDERFSYLEAYTEVGLLFLAVSIVASQLVDRLERRFGQL